MFHELNKTQRKLLLSFFLFALASPMIVVYSNTFLWRQSQDPITLAIFNIGNYVGIAIGFVINAFLLRKFQSGQLYALGCLLQGIIPLCLIALGAQANTYALLLGLLLGIAQGFFWGNRNALTSKGTQGPQRYQFISLETASGILAGIVSPLLIGWFIAHSQSLSSYTVTQAYQISSVLGLILLIISGLLALPLVTEPFVTKKFFLASVSPFWKKQRFIELINGIYSGIESVLPLLIILLFLGQEEAVGSIKALTSVLSAWVIYVIGKRVKHKHHTVLVGLWMVFTFIGSVLFTFWYSATAALLFFILSGLVGSLRWSSFAAVMYETIDHEIKHDGNHRFLYLLDRELFLNLGRILGLGAFMVLYLIDSQLLIRYGLILIIFIQIPNLFLLNHMTKRLAHTAKTIQNA